MMQWMKVAAFTIPITGTVAGGTWGTAEYIHNTLATKVDVSKVEDQTLVADAKASFIVMKQMEAISSEIGYLEAKKHKTPEDLNRLDYLRKQLELMRQIQAGKASK